MSTPHFSFLVCLILAAPFVAGNPDAPEANHGAPAHVADPPEVAWHPLGEGTNGPVRALAIADDGSVYAGGEFTEAGGQPALRIARWDGEAWHPLGGGFDGAVYALAFAPDGTLYAGGFFTEAGGEAAAYVAAWDGEMWHPVGGGLDSRVYVLTVGPDGTLYAGGGPPDESQTGFVAQWDGESWTYLATGVQCCFRALRVGPDGDLYAGGWFSDIGDESFDNVARWDGQSWSAVGQGLQGPPYEFVFSSSGILYAAGVGLGGFAHGLAWWDGTSWASPEQVDPTVFALALGSEGSLYLGGSFARAGGQWVYRIARWDGQDWYALGTGMDAPVHALAIDAEGVLYAGGEFTSAGGVSASFVARATGLPVSSEPAAPYTAQLRIMGTSPNPAAGVVRVAYELPEAAHVRVAVFDLLGREVARVVDAQQPAGAHEAVLTLDGLSAGTYVIRLEALGQAAMRRMVVVR